MADKSPSTQPSVECDLAENLNSRSKVASLPVDSREVDGRSAIPGEVESSVFPGKERSLHCYRFVSFERNIW